MIKLPKRGKVIGWKKLQDFLICKLEIPSNAKRVQVHGPSGKCRAERALVLDIEIGDPGAREWNTAHGKDNKVNGGSSIFYQNRLYYSVGKMVEADMFDSDPTKDCSHGIHFFLTRAEAEAFGA